jgi:hypothetical protein
MELTNYLLEFKVSIDKDLFARSTTIRHGSSISIDIDTFKDGWPALPFSNNLNELRFEILEILSFGAQNTELLNIKST